MAVSARERGHALLEEEEAAEAVLEEAREALAPPRPPPPRAAAEAQLDAAVLADATRLYEHAMSLHGVEAEAAAEDPRGRSASACSSGASRRSRSSGAAGEASQVKFDAPPRERELDRAPR